MAVFNTGPADFSFRSCVLDYQAWFWTWAVFSYDAAALVFR